MPLFIVGSSRSGTELIRSVLNRHRDVYIARETHYFDDLRPRVRTPGATLSPKDAARVESYFFELSQTAYGFAEAADRPIVPSCESGSRSADEAFALHCQHNAPFGSKLWGEKTPRHIFRLGDMLEAFPDAQILVMVRDPRAAVVSYRDWRNGWVDRDSLAPAAVAAFDREERRVRQSYDITTIALLWRAAAVAALRAQRRWGPGRVRLLRFEDLLADPDTCARDLCSWAGLRYDAAMLEIAVVNSSYVKAGVVAGFDQEPAARWRTLLSADESSYVDLLTHSVAGSLGYKACGAPLRWGFAARRFVSAPFGVVRAAVANAQRIGNPAQYVLARLGALVTVGMAPDMSAQADDRFAGSRTD